MIELMIKTVNAIEIAKRCYSGISSPDALTIKGVTYMSKNVKLTIVAIIVVIVAIAIFFVWAIKSGLFSKPPLEDQYDINIKIVNTTYPSDVIIYGEDINFRSSFLYRKVNNLNEQSLHSEEYDYKFIIICDREGSVNITSEDYDFLLRLIQDEGYCLIYIGSEKLDDFKNHGFFTMLDSGIKGFMKIPSSSTQGVVQGFWTEQEETIFTTYNELLGKTLLMLMADYIKGIF